jgi:hypothetical protein
MTIEILINKRPKDVKVAEELNPRTRVRDPYDAPESAFDSEFLEGFAGLGTAPADLVTGSQG